MPYSSVSSIVLIVPNLPQTTTSTGYSETSAIIGRHITRADSIINGKISKRYSVPIAPTPPLLGTLSEDITAYFTYRSFYTQDNFNRMEYFGELKDDALKTLNEIMAGDIDLVDANGNVIEEKTTATSETSLVDSTHIDMQPFFDVDEPTSWDFDDARKDDVYR